MADMNHTSRHTPTQDEPPKHQTITDELRQEIAVLDNATLSRLLRTYDSITSRHIPLIEDTNLLRMYTRDIAVIREFTGRTLELAEILRAAISFRPFVRTKPQPYMPPSYVDYNEYIKSEAWKQKRTQALERAQNRCQLCNTPSLLHVHHRTYERLGNEDLADLTVLCERCHRMFHRRGELYKGGADNA